MHGSSLLSVCLSFNGSGTAGMNWMHIKMRFQVLRLSMLHLISMCILIDPFPVQMPELHTAGLGAAAVLHSAHVQGLWLIFSMGEISLEDTGTPTCVLWAQFFPMLYFKTECPSHFEGSCGGAEVGFWSYLWCHLSTQHVHTHDIHFTNRGSDAYKWIHQTEVSFLMGSEPSPEQAH